jgi:hypothetical protein
MVYLPLFYLSYVIHTHLTTMYLGVISGNLSFIFDHVRRAITDTPRVLQVINVIIKNVYLVHIFTGGIWTNMFKSQSDIIFLCFDMDEMSLINALIVVHRIPPLLGYNTVYPVTFCCGIIETSCRLCELSSRLKTLPRASLLLSTTCRWQTFYWCNENVHNSLQYA